MLAILTKALSIVFMVTLVLVLSVVMFAFLAYRQFGFFNPSFFIPYEEMFGAFRSGDPFAVFEAPVISVNMTSGLLLSNMYSLDVGQLLLSVGLGVVMGLTLAEFGYGYVLDFGMVDDQPFWCETAPKHKNKTEPLLCLPYPIELNDQPAMVFRRDSPDEFFAAAMDQFDEMLRATEKYSQVFVVSLHSFIVGQPYRLKHLRRLLEHIKSHEADTWITKPGEIAAYYRGLSGD